MPPLTLDVALFSAFLALNLIVGLSYGRKVKTIQDYALGGKNFATSTIVATIVATWYGGGSLFRALETTYTKGLYYILPILGAPIGLWLSGQLVVRMSQFLNNVSVAEALGDLYGKRVQIITALSGIMAKTGAGRDSVSSHIQNFSHSFSVRKHKCHFIGCKRRHCILFLGRHPRGYVYRCAPVLHLWHPYSSAGTDHLEQDTRSYTNFC